MRPRTTLGLILGVVCAAAALGFAGPAAATSATVTDPLNASNNDECFRCHAAANVNQTVDVNGTKTSIAVNQPVYEHSRHGKLACTSCHIGFKPGVHTAEQTANWVQTAKLLACRDCHADVFQMYRGSFHGNLVFGTSSGEAPV